MSEIKLDKNEKIVLAVDRFISKVKKNFSGIEFVSVYIPNIENCPSEYNKGKDVFPLVVRILSKNDKSEYSCEYSWKKDVSDDEYPLYDNYDSSWNFHEVRDFIKQNLPEAFKGKSFYRDERYLNSNNLPPMLDIIKSKILAIELDQQLKSNTNKTKTSKPKI